MSNYDDTTAYDFTELQGEVLYEEFDDNADVNDDLQSYFKSIDDNFFNDPY